MAAVAHAAEPPPSFDLRAEGSFPFQYQQTQTATSRQNSETAAPFGALTATAHLSNDWSASVFGNAGHDQLGRFRDNDNTFASYGSNIAKRWGGLLTGASIEHTYYYTGSFGQTSSIANDVNVFARYEWKPRVDLMITPMLVGTTRLDDAWVTQRYSVGVSFDIQQRLIGNWWFVTMPRIRYSSYVGAEAGRRDVSLSTVAGLRYRFNDHVSFTTLAGGESRSSTVVDKRREKFVAGASLDFDFDLLRWR